ncbi:MAG TPA: DUF1015 domain-containing protein [Anaerolineae bacterium]|nr:DUF1015 domain-containing protein [Anaerolineae bacterium]HQH39420.1 DUF1015 domain-containing protein [Anaerolineae bacterium]
MTHIRPFRGLRYNPDKFCDLSDVITMPYDRIDAAEQAQYYDLSPYNYVRLIQGRHTPDDTTENNVYTRARGYLYNWLAEEVFIRDPAPALYVLEQTFTTPDGVERTRRGLTAALELTPFDEGVVLPHEHTLSGPKMDRLNLTRATAMSWEHIFMLYPDATAVINTLLQPFLDTHMPALVHEQVIETDVEQAFWVVNDPALISAVVTEMATKQPLIIADGHHRYETALNYRAEMRQQHPDAPADAAFNDVMVTFVSMSDPGLVVLPTHRLVHSYTMMNGKSLLQALEPYFVIETVPDRAALEAGLAAATSNHPRFGFYDGAYTLLTLKTLNAMAALAPNRDPHWRALDVAVLHALVIEHVMGLSKESVQRLENLTYLRDPDPGYVAVDKGEANFLFLLNPTRIEQIQACTVAGERMPQKSTDFFPKIVSGLVALPLQGTIGS